MKIRNELILIIVTILLAGVLIQSILASKYIDNYFNNYIMEQYTENISRISLIAQEIIIEKEISGANRPMMSQMSYRRTLVSYMIDPIIEINIYSNYNSLIFSSNGAGGQGYLHKANSQTLNSEIDKFDILDDSKNIIGKLEIIRSENVENWQTSVLFNKALISGTIISFIIVAIISGIVIVIVSSKFAKQLTDTAKYASKIEQDGQIEVELSNTIEIKQIQLTLQNLASRLKLKTKIRKEKADKLVHETRTPLTILKSNIEATIDKVITLDEANLNLCLSQVDNLTQLMSNITEIITDDIEENTVELEKIDLTKEIKNIIKSLSLQYSHKKISLSSDLENDIKIYSDKNKINQSIYNLLTNACKFTPNNGNVKISLRKLQNEIEIEVKDNGKGVKPEELDKIFTAYYRSKQHLDSQGDGLGLYIVSTNMILLNGKAIANINNDNGLTIKLIIPMNHI